MIELREGPGLGSTCIFYDVLPQDSTREALWLKLFVDGGSFGFSCFFSSCCETIFH